MQDTPCQTAFKKQEIQRRTQEAQNDAKDVTKGDTKYIKIQTEGIQRICRMARG